MLCDQNKKRVKVVRSLKSNRKKALIKSSSNETKEIDDFRIFDENGEDVTPRPIDDSVRLNLFFPQHDDEILNSRRASKFTLDNLDVSFSDKSTSATTNLTSSISRMGKTGTKFSLGATLDIGTRLIADAEHLLVQMQSDQTFDPTSDDQITKALFLPAIQQNQTNFVVDSIILTETETIFILDFISEVVSKNDVAEYEEIEKKNQRYSRFCQNRRENDALVDRAMQTFNDLTQNQSVSSDPIFIRSVEVSANSWQIAQALNQNVDKIHQPLRKEESHSVLTSYSNSKERNVISSESSRAQSSSQNSKLLSEESTLKMKFSQQKCFTLNDENVEQLPKIDVDGFVMERILNLNVYFVKESIFRGKTHDGENRFSRENSLSMNITNVSLQRLWFYKCYLTENRHVSCLALSEKNHNLLAVGYGRVQYNDDREGLVCCWNTKNPEFPERQYQTETGVTSLSFSLKRPNLLAVGLFNGNICVFDLNFNKTLPIVTTKNDEKRHQSPVWQINWKIRDRSTDIENIETLISISADGRVTQWTLRKEFEASDLMRLKPFNNSQTTCQIESKAEGISIDRYFSNFIGGFSFDFRSTDETIYLCGIDDGLIHRCSTIYNEKYLNSYRGHKNSVYKVRWSPFVEKIFLSASADWTVRIWMIDDEKTSMSFPSINAKAILDAIWSPKFPTMFFYIDEDSITIWDLHRNALDPIYVANCDEKYKLTTIVYAADSDCLFVGTNEGSVWIYHLENLSSSGTEIDLIRIVQENIFNQQDSFNEENLPKQLSSTSIESIFPS